MPRPPTGGMEQRNIAWAWSYARPVLLPLGNEVRRGWAVLPRGATPQVLGLFRIPRDQPVGAMKG